MDTPIRGVCSFIDQKLTVSVPHECYSADIMYGNLPLIQQATRVRQHLVPTNQIPLSRLLPNDIFPSSPTNLSVIVVVALAPHEPAGTSGGGMPPQRDKAEPLLETRTPLYQSLGSPVRHTSNQYGFLTLITIHGSRNKR